MVKLREKSFYLDDEGVKGVRENLAENDTGREGWPAVLRGSLEQ